MKTPLQTASLQFWYGILDWGLTIVLLIVGADFLKPHLINAGIVLYQFFFQASYQLHFPNDPELLSAP